MSSSPKERERERVRSFMTSPSPSPAPFRMKEILQDTVQWFLRELRESGSADEIEKQIVDPILKRILERLLPYIITSSIIFLFVIIGLVVAIAWFLPARVIRAET